MTTIFYPSTQIILYDRRQFDTCQPNFQDHEQPVITIYIKETHPKVLESIRELLQAIETSEDNDLDDLHRVAALLIEKLSIHNTIIITSHDIPFSYRTIRLWNECNTPFIKVEYETNHGQETAYRQPVLTFLKETNLDIYEQG